VRGSRAEGERGSRRFRPFRRREVWLLEMAVQGEPESNLQKKLMPLRYVWMVEVRIERCA